MTSVSLFTASTSYQKKRTLPISLAQGDTEILINISQFPDFEEAEVYKKLVFHFGGATLADVAQQKSEVLLRAAFTPGYSVQSATVIKSEYIGLGDLDQEIAIAFAVDSPSTLSATISVPLGPVSMWFSVGDV